MLSDPWFFAVAIPAVILFGISKSGFGGAFGAISVPIMALAISPVQAAAILLPILCLMDLLGLWAYRGKWVRSELRILLPAALLGIGIGTALFEYMNADVIRLIIGAIALVFAIHYWTQNTGPRREQTEALPTATGIVSAGLAGFTSFVAHAGGPPLSMYLLRRSLDKTEFVATTVVFFAVVVGVSLWKSRREQDSEDYFLAGRNLGWFVVGASIFASNIGSEHLVGLAGSGTTDGVAMAHYELHAWCLLVLGWVFVPFYMRSRVYTMPEFLERRFNATSRWMLSVISLVAYVLTKIAVGIFAGGIVFSVLLPDLKGDIDF